MKDVAKHKLHELCAIIQKTNPSSPPTPTPGDNPGAKAGIELFRIETFGTGTKAILSTYFFSLPTQLLHEKTKR